MLPQNPVIQPEKTDYGEVALKVPNPKKSDRVQRKPEPLNPARSFYKQVRKKLSCPATQIRIFLSVVLLFGTVLTIGYVVDSVTVEHGANRTLKMEHVKRFGRFLGIGNSRSNAGTEIPDSDKAAQLKTKTPNGEYTAMVTYDATKKSIKIGGTPYTIDNENLWLSEGDPKKTGDARYDIILYKDSPQIYLKTVRNLRGTDTSGVALMNAIREGIKKSMKTLTLDFDYVKLPPAEGMKLDYKGGEVHPDNMWKATVYNKHLHGVFSKGKQTLRAYGKFSENGSYSKEIDTSYYVPKFEFQVPVSPNQLAEDSFEIIVYFRGEHPKPDCFNLFRVNGDVLKLVSSRCFE